MNDAPDKRPEKPSAPEPTRSGMRILIVVSKPRETFCFASTQAAPARRSATGVSMIELVAF